MIQLHQAHKSFRNQQQLIPILDIEHWHVSEGDQIALLGPSGSGKSTLLYVLCGVLPVDEGECIIRHEPLHRMSELERDRFRSKHVGIIFQDFHLISSLTAKQNIELVYEGPLNGRERYQHIQQWFERVGLQERMNHLPSQLSRGQQQRVAMIRALINRPTLLLADEPTGSLDYETAHLTMNLLLTLSEEEGATLITVTHDQHLAAHYPKQVHISTINQHAMIQGPVNWGSSIATGAKQA
ncbi:ABC transporter ATP-binding protein [Paenibacillus profundus]|uniref:ABC transporter ATP-binding protein n=1 Tax=Paenibacillus profundus TaxID=1173085 RepID=A0ABS8YP73_9BACL|nr:ABC transporter ATP-binding protein [Paenibacillus profundus]MCE5171399.1 ABC transporter ATP-binding protein [Paenibacillus profundus]